MNENHDQPLQFHNSFDKLLDDFRNIIASVTWLKVSTRQAEDFYKNFPYIIELPSSLSEKKIKVEKSILKLIERDSRYSSTLINFYRIFTIAIKDIIWEEADFESYLQNEIFQFLRHLRNACAHNNQFYWGRGNQRASTVQKLPMSWRGKIIEESIEGSNLYMDFMKPGDIFMLLSDISAVLR